SRTHAPDLPGAGTAHVIAGEPGRSDRRGVSGSAAGGFDLRLAGRITPGAVPAETLCRVATPCPGRWRRVLGARCGGLFDASSYRGGVSRHGRVSGVAPPGAERPDRVPAR